MRRFYSIPLFVVTVLAVVLLASFATVFAKNVPVITKEELKPIMNDQDVVILDVRRGRDWSSSEFKIRGADRVDPRKMKDWAKNYSKDQKLVLYCA